MDFDSAEEQDGIRFSWNVWPSSRLECTRLVVPIGCTYTPLKENIPLVYYEPVQCKGSCRSILNPFCSVDFRAKLWVCPFCFQRNQFPPNYADISENNLPAELISKYTTIEYVLTRGSPVPPPVFLFLVDICLIEEELQELKNSLLMSLTLMPENALVGLITYGKTVQLYELAFEEIPKCYVFNGNKDISGKQLQDLLALGSKLQRGVQGVNVALKSNRFLMPLSEAEFSLTTILEELQRDPHTVRSDRRPLRATGVALAVAIGLLEVTCPNTHGGRILLFTGGPATHGPGLVVGDDLKEPIRSHTDLSKDTAKHARKAMKFYETLSKRAVSSGHVVDIFACSYDQSGFYEMQDLPKRTGGLVVLADSFESSMFKQSFQRIFTKNEKGQMPMGFNASIEIQTSKEIKICGAIGHCASLNRKSTSVAETEIGIGNTSAWRICGLDLNSTVAFYFEVVNQHSNPIPPGQKGLIQFLTSYQTVGGQRILRVTTVGRSWTDGTQKELIAQGFDQEAAAVLIARMAVNKAENEEAFDVLRWLDRMLIRLVSKFADYRKDDVSSFSLSPNFSIYPQFMFHLRRGHFFQVWNSSPDETAFYRYMLNRENVLNALVMIQPTLEAYAMNAPTTPVLLASTSIQPDKILLLDTFFRIVIQTGETLANWRNAGYAEDPNYVHFKLLLQAPKADANAIMKKRFPVPRLIECDQHTSQARFLLATIDPVVTHTTMGNGSGEVIFTDDVNLKVFMEHLKKLSVQP